MVKTEYDHIYTQLRNRTESRIYPYQNLPASEHILIKRFDCSRNTVRWVIGRLVGEGYIQSIHGKGTQVVYQPQEQSEFFLSNIKSMKGAVARSRKSYTTRMVYFIELTVDRKIQVWTVFPLGEQIYYIQRMRYTGRGALIIDHNYFLKCVVKSPTPEIAQEFIHEHMEQELGESIVTTKRKMIVERMNQIDEKYLDMKGCSRIAVASSITYDAQGIMSEFTQSRHRLDRFVFCDLAHRVK